MIWEELGEGNEYDQKTYEKYKIKEIKLILSENK